MDFAKLWIPIIGIFLAVGGLFTFRHFELVDKANAEMLTARLYLEQAQQSLEARSTSWNNLNAALIDFTAAKTRLDKSTSGKDIADSKQRLVEGDLAYLVKSMPGIVEKVRTAAIGTTLTEVVLNDSKVLKNAQIKKIEETGMSFIHSEGFGSVPLDNLPAALVEQFDLGPNSLVKRIKKLDEFIKDPSAAGKSTSISEPAPVPAATKSAAASVIEAKLKTIRLRLAEMDAQALTLSTNMESWERNANSYAEQAASAAGRGVPTVKFRTEEQKARAQVAQIKQQLLVLYADYKKLKVEEDFAVSGAAAK